MPPIVSAHNISTHFGDVQIHDGVSFDVSKGEIIGIAGGSGSGKSVLLRTIIGLNKPTSGDVVILGHSMNQTHFQAPLDVRKKWGVQFQSGALFSSLTVLENIKVPFQELTTLPSDVIHELAFLKLVMVGLAPSDAIKYPFELSGGMVKRASLARALALDPAILFLDEPTSGLDPISASAYDELILSLQKNLDLTVVMVTHDLDSLYTLCDRVIILVDKKAKVGTLGEIVKDTHPWIQHYFHGPRGRSLQGK